MSDIYRADKISWAEPESTREADSQRTESTDCHETSFKKIIRADTLGGKGKEGSERVSWSEWEVLADQLPALRAKVMGVCYEGALQVLFLFASPGLSLVPGA